VQGLWTGKLNHRISSAMLARARASWSPATRELCVMVPAHPFPSCVPLCVSVSKELGQPQAARERRGVDPERLSRADAGSLENAGEKWIRAPRRAEELDENRNQLMEAGRRVTVSLLAESPGHPPMPLAKLMQERKRAAWIPPPSCGGTAALSPASWPTYRSGVSISRERA